MSLNASPHALYNLDLRSHHSIQYLSCVVIMSISLSGTLGFGANTLEVTTRNRNGNPSLPDP